jgi:hypothetical protein
MFKKPNVLASSSIVDIEFWDLKLLSNRVKYLLITFGIGWLIK